ncbi:MAG: hypothetical protein IT442_06595, partial [Phycisphaeraceae bacterium]|nr:hypothetical protein [Phycisphaeraceae bacterium]
MADSRRSSENWGTRLGVIMAVMGSAVGLGNFLRFPGLAAQYEGGAFMIPYFVAMLLLGFPLAWAEWAMGRYGGARGFNSTPGIYRAIWPRKFSPYMGVLGMIVPVIIYMYYVLIESWCLAYAWYFLTGQMADLGETARLADGTLDKSVFVNFFSNFAGMGENAQAMTVQGRGGSALVFLLICFAANFTLIYRGLTRGIETFCKIAMPALILCALIVLVRVLTLPWTQVNPALGFMWNPRTENQDFMAALLNPNMWLDATSQIFFSLSV